MIWIKSDVMLFINFSTMDKINYYAPPTSYMYAEKMEPVYIYMHGYNIII